jgi:hypothetical protein
MNIKMNELSFVGFISKGFSVKESFELWKYKMKIFHPNIYNFMKYITIKCNIAYLYILLLKDKYTKIK